MSTKTMAATLAAMLLCGWTRAGNDGTNQSPVTLRLELDLVDGSRLIGSPALTTFPVQTPYAKTAIPITQFRRIAMADDHETSEMIFRNGDRIKGILDLKALDVETVFGKVSVNIVHVRAIEVRARHRIPGVRPSTAPDQGLVLHYAFDRDLGKTVTDARNPESRGTAVQDAAWTRDGLRGGAFAFGGGGGYVQASSPQGLTIATLSLWLKVEALPKAAPFAAVSYCGGGQNAMEHDKDIRVMPDGTFAFYTWNGGAGAQVTSTTKLTEGNWYHVVGVVDGAKIKIYLDGALEAATDAGPSWGGGSCFVLSFVKSFGPTHESYRGSVDELRIYDRALSEEDVKRLFLYDGVE